MICAIRATAFAASGRAGLRDLMARMGHDSERAMIYPHEARGADQAITSAIDSASKPSSTATRTTTARRARSSPWAEWSPAGARQRTLAGNAGSGCGEGARVSRLAGWGSRLTW